MEAMARPWNQWHHDPSNVPQQAQYRDIRSSYGEQRVPRLSTLPDIPSRLPLPHQGSSRRGSLQSSHAGTSSPLERSPPGHHTFSNAQHSAGPPRGAFYDFPSLSGQSSPSLSARPEPNYARPRQASEASSSISQYGFARTPQVTNLVTGQSGNHYFPRPQDPRLSQSPQQPMHQVAGSGGARAQSPRQSPRNNMAVHALLNDEITSKGKAILLPASQAVVSPAGKYQPLAPLGRPDEVQYQLSLRQQPVNARSCGFGDRDRRVIDPPPIVQLKVVTPGISGDELTSKLKHPMNIVHCSIWSASGTEEMSGMPDEYTRQKRLMGNLVASPFVGIDEHGVEGCFFCFPDISCRTPGKYRLKFSLISLDHRPGAKSPVKVEVLSDVFQTFSAKEFPGMSESSALAKTLKYQGCNIPTKKGNETGRSGKREDSDGVSDDDESPRRKRPKNQ